jgi:hypothetical protein
MALAERPRVKGTKELAATADDVVAADMLLEEEDTRE